MDRGIIEKWGGTSLATAKRDKTALDHTVNSFKTECHKDSYAILVPSGPGKTDNTREGRKATDHAYDIINKKNPEQEWIILEKILRNKVNDHQLSQTIIDPLISEVTTILQSNNLNPEAEAKIIGLPERAEARILYHLGQQLYPKINFALLDYNENGMIGQVTSNNRDIPVDHTQTLRSIARVAKEKELKGKVTIVPGFIGTKKGTNEMVTLERGMSDGTATYFGAALYANEVRIFSDQDGILPVDPDIIEGSKPIIELTYREAEAFAGLGAKIINDVALLPARERGILVKILNSFDHNQTGTKISANPTTEHYGVKAIAHVPGYQLITVYNMRMNQKGIAAEVASLFTEHDLSIDSDVDSDSCRTYAVIPNKNVAILQQILAERGHRTRTTNLMTRIALIGEGMDYIPSMSAKTPDQILTETIRACGIHSEMHSKAPDAVIRSIFIEEEYTHQLITHLYRAFGFHRSEK